MTIFGITPDSATPTYGSSTTSTTNTTAATQIAGLDEAGNVPLVKPQDKPIVGITLERTAQADPATKPAEKAAQTDVFNPKAKAGRGLDQALTAFYGDKYTKASEEDKEKLIVKYFDWLSKEQKDNKISQLDQFKLYRDRCKDPEEYRRLSSVIDKMEARYQLSAARGVVLEGTDRQRDVGTRAVAGDIQNYDRSVQVGATQLVAHSGNQEANRIGASHASELASENQVKAVSLYENATINSKDPAEIKTFKTGIDKILINQYGNYAQENQLAIHKIMSSSQYSETVQYAAQNIGQFQDKNIREEAYQITVSTGDQEAIKYGQASKEAADNEDDAEETQDSECPEDNDTPNCKQAEQERTNEESDNNLTTIEKIEDFSKALSSATNSISQGEIVKNTSDGVKIFLAQTTSSVSVLEALLSNAPSRELFNAALDNLSSLPDDPDKKALILSLHQGGELTEDMMKNNPGLQLTVMRSTNNIQGIKREYLSVLGKYWFDKIKGEQQKKSGSVA